MEYICFICPLCKEHSKNMGLLPHKYIPEQRDMVTSKKWVFDMGIQEEMLECRCGGIWTWFDLRKVIINKRPSKKIFLALRKRMRRKYRR